MVDDDAGDGATMVIDTSQFIDGKSVASGSRPHIRPTNLNDAIFSGTDEDLPAMCRSKTQDRKDGCDVLPARRSLIRLIKFLWLLAV